MSLIIKHLLVLHVLLYNSKQIFTTLLMKLMKIKIFNHINNKL